MKFNVIFFDDSRTQYHFSVSASNEADAQEQVCGVLSGLKGSGVMRQVTQFRGVEYVGSAIAFQIPVNNGDAQNGNAA